MVNVDPDQPDRATASSSFISNPFGTLPNGDPTNQRLAIVQQAVKTGCNTNYAQSWFMARAHLRTKANSTNPRIIQTRGNLGDQSGGQAGIAVRFIEKSHVATSAIPLLGDASPGDLSEAVLTDTLSWALPKGSRLTKSYGNGPSFINAKVITAGIAPPISILSCYTTENPTVATWGISPSVLGQGIINAPAVGGVPAVTAFIDDILPLPDDDTYGGVDISRGQPGQLPPPGDGVNDRNVHLAIDGYGGNDGVLVLQDTRAFSALHGSGRNKRCNILFADTAVKSILDPNGDSYINPGFPLTNSVRPTAAERAILEVGSGYTNNRCESAPAEFYNGLSLNFAISPHGPSWWTP